jgi:CRP-like cAMP-binding protein
MDAALSDRLCRVPLFADLDHDHLASVAALVDEFEAEPGLVLLQPGLVGAGLFVIEEGEAVASVLDRDVTLGPGEIIGELALLDDHGVHTVRVKTKTPVRGYCIGRDAFTQLLHDEPKIAIPMLRTLAKRLIDVLTHH